MSSFYLVFLIAISLSMDAFSLALVYGIIGMDKTKKILLAIIVGIYHFIMPLIGLYFGMLISNIQAINLTIITSVILIYIGINLIISSRKEEEILLPNILNFLLFGLSVSIDSLTLGIGLKTITNNYIITASIFAITSSFFTYTGLLLGQIIGSKVGNYSKIIGGITLIIIGIIMFIK